MVLSRCMSVCPDFITVIALSHIYVPAAIRRDLRRILFKRRMYHVQVTSLLRSRGVSVTYLYLYGISLSYARCIKAYVLRTCDVCMAYEVYA